LRFTRNARTAWEIVLRSVSSRFKPKVLLPAYIGYTDREGSGVFDPIEATSSEYAFYGVTRNLGIEMDPFEEHVRSGKVNIALVIHYFGFCRNDMNRVRSQCDEYNVTLVEDCAHTFNLGLKGRKLSNYGDFSFFSIHKYLPTTCGGILKVNTARFDLEPHRDLEGAPTTVLEQYAISDYEEIYRRRINNFKLYESLLPRHEGLEILFELKGEDIPQSFPVRIKSGRRKDLYFYLMKKCMPTTALYYQLITQIARNEFPLSYEISNEILNLPLHQDITSDDVSRICAQIDEYFQVHSKAV